MIPKIIHYCWFGGNPLPESAIKCIESWHKFLPDYEIKEWNESNFDVNMIPYISEAYKEKKFAFVSDYARFWILYKEGGLYFDTDVEIIKPLDDIIEKGPFMGIEVESRKSDQGMTLPLVAPGLGLGAESKMEFYDKILKYYEGQHFLDEQGNPNLTTVVKHVTKILSNNGLKASNELQNVCNIWIYPREYFNPLNDNTGVLNITNNTRSIHWYTKTWLKKRNPFRTKIIRLCHRLFGENSLGWIKKILN